MYRDTWCQMQIDWVHVAISGAIYLCACRASYVLGRDKANRNYVESFENGFQAGYDKACWEYHQKLKKHGIVEEKKNEI